MTITVNGESVEISEGVTVSGLVNHLGMRIDRVAIERNLDILPRAQWDGTPVHAGDRFEIVQLVGGGQQNFIPRKRLLN